MKKRGGSRNREKRLLAGSWLAADLWRGYLKRGSCHRSGMVDRADASNEEAEWMGILLMKIGSDNDCCWYL